MVATMKQSCFLSLTLLTSRDSVFLKISLPLGNEKKRKEEMTSISAPLIKSFF